MGEYIQTDYLWEAIGNLRSAAKQPDYSACDDDLLEMAEALQLLHDNYFSG